MWSRLTLAPGPGCLETKLSVWLPGDIGILQPFFNLCPHRQCHECCFSSGDELVPTIAGWDEHASRCGRKIQPPKVLCYPEDQVRDLPELVLKTSVS